MTRRVRLLIQVLIAAQALSLPSFASALPADPASGDDCAAMMQRAADTDPCPCCPDDVTSTAACLSACMPLIGALPATWADATPTSSVAPPEREAAPRPAASDPPLTPPPIR